MIERPLGDEVEDAGRYLAEVNDGVKSAETFFVGMVVYVVGTHLEGLACHGRFGGFSVLARALSGNERVVGAGYRQPLRLEPADGV